jgi:dTDP-4-amino-4,6-dideoxygalactose transaminase
VTEGSIPFVRLDNEATWEAVRPRLEWLVRSGEFTLGPQVESFERAVASKFGCRWAVGTSSGTSALTLALRALPLEPRSRVAIPANTFFATLEAVVLAGHIPVVVDHDEDHLFALESLEDLHPDAVIPVHLHGLAVDMISLESVATREGWWVVEDCSQAHGALVDDQPVGSFGHLGAFSAYPTKNLGAWGDAGFVTGGDPEMERGIRARRHHGQYEADVHQVLGGNARLDSVQALVLEEKLRRLESEVESRRQIARWYSQELGDSGIALPGDRGGRFHAFHHYVISVPDRGGLRAHLGAKGIGTGVHYPVPVHLQPAAAGVCEVPRQPLRAERSCREVLSLPIYPGLSREDVSRIGKAIREFGKSS